jgi:hypothetical protein
MTTGMGIERDFFAFKAVATAAALAATTVRD